MFNYAPTPYDLRFTIFGFRTRVHPLFWLLGILLYSWVIQADSLSPPFKIAVLATGLACVFLSIMVHELGHAFLIRHEGFESEIVLHMMGGHAMYHPFRPISSRMKMAISFAGPGAGFILYGLVFGLETLVTRLADPEVYFSQRFFLIHFAFHELLYINLWWGIFNLIPIYPLDGGHIVRAWMQGRWGLNGLVNSLYLSMALCIVMMLTFYRLTGYNLLSMPVVLFALFCFENYQECQQVGYGGRW